MAALTEARSRSGPLPRPTARSTGRSIAAWSAFSLALFAATYLLLLGNRANLVDEAWMLWITHRLTEGDRLYSDVYYVSTPVAAWLSAGVATVAGVQLTVLRALEAAIFVAEFMVVLSIARWCRISKPALVIFGGAVFAVGSPATEWISVYSSLSILFALVALRLVLVWHDRRGTGPARQITAVLVAAGAACGLSFASKPNVGMLVLGATLAGAWVIRGAAIEQHPLRAPSIIAGGFVGTAALMALVIMVVGAWSDFVSQVFGAKGDYLGVGQSYWTTLERHTDVLSRLFDDGERGLRVLHAAVIWLPIALVVTVVWAVIRARGPARREAVMFSLFTVAALASMFPRPGSNHLAGVAPLALVATLGAVTRIDPQPARRRARQAAGVVAAIVVLAAVITIVAHSRAGYHDPLVTRSGFPHFSDTAVPERFEVGVAQLREFADTRTDGRIFFLREDAGFWYLTTGIRNPLPFDIPEVSDFGADGETGVIRRLARGDAEWVCLRPEEEEHNGVLEPRKIARWVRANFEHVDSVRQCDMYRYAGTPPSGRRGQESR